MISRNIFLYLGITLFAISISAEPLSHDHHEEDSHHHDDSCLIWHFVEISSLDNQNISILNIRFNNYFEGVSKSSLKETYRSPYSSRATPKI
jgi:hypothetical protein